MVSPTPTAPAPGLGAHKFLIIAAVVLGAWGVFFNGGMNLINLVQTKEGAISRARWGAEIGGKLGPPQSRSSPIAAVQEEMAAAIVDAQWKTRPWQLAVGFLGVPFALALLAGSILVLKRSEGGRRLLRGAAWGMVPWELASMVVGIAIALDTVGISLAYAQKMMATVPHAPAAMANIMGGAMQASQYVGLAIGAAWKLGLCIYFVILARHLDKPAVRQLCGP